MSLYVYVLYSSTCDRYYIGQTDDLDRRVGQHNDPGNHFSKTTKMLSDPWQLIYAEKYQTRTEAVRRERALKSGRRRQFLLEQLPKAGGC